LAKGLARAPSRNSDVFINCAFDDDYRPCFEATLFTVTISGYRPRCALEENDAGDIRFDKLRRLLAESDHTIHDLSRTESRTQGRPRGQNCCAPGLRSMPREAIFCPPHHARVACRGTF
jgi:hypothetical protein